jgi:hypothetical protein
MGRNAWNSFNNSVNLINMNESFDLNTRGERLLPKIKVFNGRSTSARLSIEDNEPLDQTPYFNHPRVQSSSFEPFFEGQSISRMYIRILQEQSKLKHKINQQAKFIQSMCKRPPICIQKKIFNENKENKEVTFMGFDFSSTKKEVKRFHFPRDVFSQKKKARN